MPEFKDLVFCILFSVFSLVSITISFFPLFSSSVVICASLRLGGDVTRHWRAYTSDAVFTQDLQKIQEILRES
jgi:hypothetical protein